MRKKLLDENRDNYKSTLELRKIKGNLLESIQKHDKSWLSKTSFKAWLNETSSKQSKPSKENNEPYPFEMSQRMLM